MKIALVKNGVIDNVAEFNAFEEALAMSNDLQATPVDVTHLSAWIGDSYDGTNFYRAGSPLISMFESEYRPLLYEIEDLAEANKILMGEADSDDSSGTSPRIPWKN